MRVTIDDNSGFCFGVINAIKKAEEELSTSGKLYCLGHIVHNNAEVERLEEAGLITVSHEEFAQLRNCTVLIRAHGEPPETYKTARTNNIRLIDATCPVVLKLQQRIKKSFDEMGEKGQLLIFGKEGHAEVNGLVGQTEGKAIVIKEISDLEKINPDKEIAFFSQTTMDIEAFKELSKKIDDRFCDSDAKKVKINDTICRQVANRAPHLRIFAAENEVILFVSGKESSNGKYLYKVCKEVNPNSYFINQASEIDFSWIKGAKSVGICGATSTPRWQMEEVAKKISEL